MTASDLVAFPLLLFENHYFFILHVTKHGCLDRRAGDIWRAELRLLVVTNQQDLFEFDF